MRFVTNNGYTFGIDTCDWQNTRDGELASEMIEADILRWSPDQAERYHDILSSDDIDFESPEYLEIAGFGKAVFEEITKSYSTVIFVGHNCEIFAA